ncbi:hypothetical protein [Flavobacterium sp.]|uniref:hypothetical protein n=1 Tax=Flavobacterium sp. TaxID=239 RepID=UPI003D29E777
MKKLFLGFLFLGFLTLQSCKNNDYSSEEVDVENESYNEVVYEDGESYSDNTYCADVEYYNSNTGTRSTYTLNVEVENNEVTVIHFPNGGWLDDDHFYPEELDSNGYCSFTSDKGYEYSVQITGSACSFTDETRMQYDIEDDEESITCPECGDDKSEYDDYCYSCKRKFTCNECNGKKDKYDDVCSDCKRKQEEEEDNPEDDY